MCGSEELIHDARQVDLEEAIKMNETPMYLVPGRLTDEQRRDFFVNMSWDVDGPEGAEDMIDAIGTPIQPCADVETVGHSDLYLPPLDPENPVVTMLLTIWTSNDLIPLVRRTDMEAQVARVAAEKDSEIANLKSAFLWVARRLCLESSIRKTYVERIANEVGTGDDLRAALNEGAAG